MDIIRSDKRNARLLVQLHHIREYTRLFVEALILKFQEKIAFAEYIQIFKCFLLRSFVISQKKMLLDIPCQTCFSFFLQQ